MYLKSLRIKGFKSFAKNVELDFEPGVSMIVGPNGSGKSNITDAVQWVLGEQSPGSLRGSSMQDVIFAGSLNHKALSLAEVTLVLDNSRKEINVDFSEVAITRRILRNGQNSYFINQTPCRLLDIFDLLHDTQLGRQKHSIIGQGKLDEIVNSKPEEKRVLLEEAAGVLKHKKRKERALRRLISTQDNLNRAKDILRELNNQIKPLEKQVEKAKNYSALNQELTRLEISALIEKISKVKSKWQKLDEKEKIILEKERPLEKELEETNEQISVKEKHYMEQEKKNEHYQKLKERLINTSKDFEKNYLLFKHKEENIKNNSAQLKDHHDGLQSQLNIKSAQLNNLKLQLEELEEEIDRNLKAIANKRKESEKLAPSHTSLKEDLDRKQSELRCAEEIIKEKETLKLSNVNDLAFIEKQLLKQEKEINDLRKEIVEREKESLKTEKIFDEINKKIQSEENMQVAIKDEIEKKKNCLRQSEIEIAEKTEEKSKLGGNLRFLEGLQQKLEPASIIKEGRSLNISSNMLAKSLKVKSRYIKAVESYLGGLAQGLVVDSIDDAVKLLKISKEKEQEINILIKEDTPDIKENEFLKKAPSWLKKIFSNVRIVESIEDIDKKDTNSVFVTLNGEIYDRGIIRADYSKNKKGLISLTNEITGVSRDLSSIEASLEELNEERSKIAELIQNEENNLENKRSDLNKIREERTTIFATINHSKELLEKSKQELEDKELSYKANKATIVNLKKINNELKEELDSLTHKKIACQKEIDELNERMHEANTAKQKHSLDLTELNYNYKNLNNQKLSAIRHVQSVTEEIEKIKDQSKKEAHKLVRNDEKIFLIGKYLPISFNLVNLCKSLVENVDLQPSQSDQLDNIKSLRSNLEQINRRIKEFEESKHKLEVDKRGLKTTLEQLTDRMLSDYGLNIESAVEKYGDVEPDNERVRQIKILLEDIGPVNAVAEEQYENMCQRKEFLEKQIDDLLNSRTSLNKIIRAIDKKVKEQMLSTFEEVRGAFKEMFARLFPGGNAELNLVGENIFESGLEIEAQPYGKSLKNLSLLSGGETALTALALLFAVYHTRPSPFYILDEVEAALDDINLQRFIRLIKDMKTKTQFIVITHQRRTMDVADCLFGVSMQANGVSKVISQNISDSKEEKTAKEQELSVS